MQLRILLLLFIISVKSFGQGYDIGITFNGAENKKIYLAAYYGDRKLIADSVFLDKNGKGRFKGEKDLLQGLYLIALPDVTYFDIIIGKDQNFSIFNDLSNITASLKVEGSDENAAFSEFQKMIYFTQEKIKKTDTSLSDAKKTAYVDSLNNILINKRQEFIEKYKGSFFSKLLYTMEEPEIPSSVLARGKNETFQYYKSNYFSHIDFNDERLTRTPILFNKFNNFFMKLCEWNPDTVVKYTLYLCEKSEGNKEFFYYVFNHMYHSLEKDGVIQNDEAFVSMLKKYNGSSYMWWADSSTIEEYSKQIRIIEPTLSGRKAPDIALRDSTNKPFDINSIKTKWVVILFWDPDCEHCIKLYEKLKEYPGRPDYSDITFISVSTLLDFDKWKTFVEANPAPFIQTITDAARPELLNSWNIFATPRIFVLDSEKRIRLKDVDPDNLLLYLNGK